MKAIGATKMCIKPCANYTTDTRFPSIALYHTPVRIACEVIPFRSFVAPCNGLQSAVVESCNQSNHAGKPGRTPSISAPMGYFTAVRPIRRTQHYWLSVLLKDTSVTAVDSYPHSADQKHQSLNLVLLTTQP